MIYQDIRQQLSQPVPQDRISSRPQGNSKTAVIHFVNVTDYKDLLDERAGIWEAFVQHYSQVGDNICVVVRLRIHADDGIFEQDGTGIESLFVNSYGDPFSNAYAQAFRRACEGHGLSRELWRNKPYAQAAADDMPANVRQRQAPPAPARRELRELATSKQLGKIRSLGRQIRVDVEEISRAEFNCDVRDLSKRDASKLIDQLDGLRKAA
jgi:hypothetical protein